MSQLHRQLVVRWTAVAVIAAVFCSPGWADKNETPVEKPLSKTICEGRRMVDVARETGRPAAIDPTPEENIIADV
jgi:hypothetical protein